MPKIYPPPELHRLIRRVAEPPNPSRHWNGNDAISRNYHGVVDLNESPLRLSLSWRENGAAEPQHIGIFELDLHRLLSKRYVRPENKIPGAVRLRFFHTPDSLIVIQWKLAEPALPIAEHH